MLTAALLGQRRSGGGVLTELFDRGLLGRSLVPLDFGLEINLMRVQEPWRLPVEAFTIPTAQGKAIHGGLYRAFIGDLGAAGRTWLKGVESELARDITPSSPVLVPVAAQFKDKTGPGQAFIATYGFSPGGAAKAAVAICKQAAQANLCTIAINLLGSGDGGLNSLEVRDEMARAIAAGGPYGSLSRVILVTLSEEAYEAPFVLAQGTAPQLLSSIKPSSEEPAETSEPSSPPVAQMPRESQTSPPLTETSEPPRPPVTPQLHDLKTPPTSAKTREPPNSPVTPQPHESGRPPAPAEIVERPSPDAEPAPAQPTALLALSLEVKNLHARLLRGDKEVWSRTLPTSLREIPWEGGSLTMDDARNLIPSWDRVPTERFGDALCALLFGAPLPGAVADVLPPDEITRLTLSLDAEAASVPWEYLRVRSTFLLEQHLSIVRHVDSVSPGKPLRIGKPASVVFAWADPGAVATFTHNDHITEISDALTAIQVPIKPVGRCDPAKLQMALGVSRGPTGGFHFLGHGEYQQGEEPYLLLHPNPGDTNQPRKTQYKLYADELSTWLLDSGVRFVFLGACHSGTVPPDSELAGLAYRIVERTGIPVVAMQVAVPQPFSSAFAARFYRCLAECSFDLERAVYKARHIIFDGRSAFGIPVLFANTTGAPAPVELPEVPERAQFHVTAGPILIDADRAAKLWDQRELPEEVRTLVKDAIDNLKTRQARAPVPTEGPALADAVRDLVRTSRLQDRATRLNDALLALREQEQDAKAARLQVPRGRIRTVDDVPLSLDWQRLDNQVNEMTGKLAQPRALFLRVIAELAAGRHILLTGPVGTGKTTLALALCRALGRTPFVATGGADWTSYDVVGGFFPQLVQPDGAPPRTEIGFRPGVFTEAVMANWSADPGLGSDAVWRRTPERTWLVLDEMNRADTDRALGPLFTALETRSLRIPAAPRSGVASAEIPVPGDFRVVATLNGADRHYLSRLSDALKRRFAFIEVPVTLELEAEWESVRARCNELGPAVDEGEEIELQRDLRRFVYLVRGFTPLGTAQLLAAARFLQTSRNTALTRAERLTQALVGSILPSLEDAAPEVLGVCGAWAESVEPARLQAALQEALARSSRGPAAPGITLPPMLDNLRAAVARLPDSAGFTVLREEPGGLCAWLVRAGGAALPELVQHLGAMRRANEGSGVGL